MAVQGVDISYWNLVVNGSIDYRKLRSLARFAFVRAHYGKARDTQFYINWTGLKEAGVLRGAYLFLRWNATPEEQADALLATLGTDIGELPPVVDFEWDTTSTPTDALLRLYRFVRRVEVVIGRKPIIYTSVGFFDPLYLNYASPKPTWLLELAQFPLWVAHYDVARPAIPAPWTTYTFWQKSSHGDGTLYGVGSKNIDLDEFNGSEQDLYNFIGQSPVTDPPPTGENMWENNALVAAFDPDSKNQIPANIDFAALKASGVHAVILQCGKPDNFLNPDDPSAAFRDSPAYGVWFRAATAAGLRVIIDYPFTAMLDSVNSFDGSVTMRYLNYLTSGGLQPAEGGALLLTMESNTWLEGWDRHSIVCPSVNYGKDLGNVFGQIWNKMHLVPGLRTGRWFLDTTDSDGAKIRDFIPWADKGQENLPMFFARWRMNNVAISGDFHDAVKNIPDPATTYITVNGQQVKEQSYYLYFGNKTKWMGYEVGTVKNAAVKYGDGTLYPFRLIIWDGTPAQFDTYFNFPASTTPPPVTDPPPSTDTTIKTEVSKIIVSLQAIIASLQAIQTKL